MLSHQKDESLKTAEITPGVPTEIHGNRSLNPKGVRVITRRLANVGIPSRMTNCVVMTQAQPNEGMPVSTAIVPRITANHIRLPQLLRQVSE